MGDAGLERYQDIGQAPPAGHVEMGDVQLRVGDGVEDHGEVLINFVGGRGPVMVGMLDIVGPHVQVSFGELHGLL